MTFPFQQDELSESSSDLPMVGGDDGLREMFAPVIAGALARGVADAFALMGVPALLIDATGRVLHAGGGVVDLLGDRVRLIEQHLVLSEPEDRLPLQRFMASAIAVDDGVPRPSVTLTDGASGLTLSAIKIPASDPSQLLRAVILVSGR